MKRDRSDHPSLPFPRALSAAIAGLVTVLSGAGLVWPRFYRDSPFFLIGWQANDLVTLAVAMPVFVASAALAARGSLPGRLIWLGLLHYVIYNDAFYLLGAELNPGFAGYIAVVLLAVAAMVAGMRGLMTSPAWPRLGPARVGRVVSVYMLVWALFLGGLWLAQWLRFVLGGPVPQIGGSVRAFALVATLDLLLLVSPLVLAGAWLWRRESRGVLLALILNVSGAVYSIVLVAGAAAQARAGVPGALGLLPLWLFFSLASALAAWRLLRRFQAGASC
jgi:hypothetical protein